MRRGRHLSICPRFEKSIDTLDARVFRAATPDHLVPLDDPSARNAAASRKELPLLGHTGQFVPELSDFSSYVDSPVTSMVTPDRMAPTQVCFLPPNINLNRSRVRGRKGLISPAETTGG